MNRATVNTMEENLSQFTSVPGEKADANEVSEQIHKSDDWFPANSNLFRAMCIVSDRQDYSYVEKVHVPENEILGLCNKLVPASAASYPGNPLRTRIHFKELDGLYLSTMGFYGDKKMMIEIFQKQCLVDDSVVSEMKDGQFKPGLYVITPKEAAGTLVVFYWHEGEHFREASRKNVSCNFIRYLVELCDCIYICVEGDYDFRALAAAATRPPPKQGRTMTIEVKRVKNSENDVKLLPGFNVRVSGNVKLETALPLFCEGYHRCCFLTAENRTPRIEVMNLKDSEFEDTINKWFSYSNVDYSRLSDEHLLDLLQNCYRGEYQKYLEWRKDFFKTGTQLGIMADKVEFDKCFMKVLPEFCSHVLLFTPTEWSGSKGRDYMDRYDQLHREFSMMITGEDGRGNADRRLLMDRSNVSFISDGIQHKITIQILGKGKPTLPFIIYEQELNVMCSSQCPCSRRIGGTSKFLPFNSSKDFLLSGDKVRLVKLGENKKLEMEGTVQLLDSRESVFAVRAWVENMVPAELKSLERNIVFATFLLSSDYATALVFIQNHLEIDNLQTLPVEFKNWVKQFQNIDAHTITMDPRKLLSHKKVTSVCSQVYKKQEHKFLENVKENLSSGLMCHQGAKHQEWKSLIKQRDAKGMITKLFGMEKDKEEPEERVKQFKPAEDKYIQELKKNMSKNREGTVVTRYIEEVAYDRPQSKLKVKVSIVEDQRLSIVWKVQELIPLKKDIDELNSNSEHPIVPTCDQSFELVAINPEQERLFKVVSLRSGEIMVFIQKINDSSLYLYRSSKIGLDINTNRPIYTFKRRVDLLAVDESSRCMALYAKDTCKIAIYNFDESFSSVHRTRVEVHLGVFTGSSIITWMHFIPGKMELLIIDNTNKVRVVEIHEKPKMNPKYIQFSWSHPISKACISADGFFLIVLRPSSDEDDDTDKKIPNIGTQLEIFVLGDMMSPLKTIPWKENAKSNVCDLEQLGLKITNFESQSHLIVYSHADAPCFLSSHVLKTVLAGEVSILQKVENKDKEVKETKIAGSCSYLAYIYHIFDKFATTPALFPEAKKSIMFKVILKSSTDPCNEACIKYSRALLKKLRKAKEKDFSYITIDFEVESLKKWITDSDCLVSVAANDKNKRKMGMWVRLLVCLVPLQIARAENNGIVALKDGLQIPPSNSIVNSVSLANSIRFGLYDAVLDGWKGKIKVISSMGKQSSGKSYLLNHLSGCLLDVSGSRCTDGVWMTLTTTEDSAHALAHGGDRCLYVLLDFEGLGSFERSEQEDMLLSVVNAAVSNLTIFNKRDFFLDKDTEIAFKRFQGGINLIEQDKKLFKGLLYIAIKDVDRDDEREIALEFSGKISHICNKSEDNFITKMYNGSFAIAPMAHYNRSDYYEESLNELADTVRKQGSFYDNGSIFLRDLKLVISQIVAKDWTSIDSKRVAQRIDIIRRDLRAVVTMGCLFFANEDDMEELFNFDTQEEVPDKPVVVGDFSINIRDQGLCLVPSNVSSIATTVRHVLSELRFKLETILPRKGMNGETWHSEFEKFLRALGERRHDRVQQWISSNTAEFSDNEEVKRLKLEAGSVLAEMQQGLSICGSKCSVCFWRCVLEKGHDQSDSAHSCMGSHLCTENCTYCLRDGDNSNQCGDLSGHKGAHNCKEKNHTCGEICHLVEISSNCNKVCSLGPDHTGLHKCNSPQHVCKTTCSLPSCNNPCSVPVDPNHIEHRCHERYCASKCNIKGCARTCGVADHFHGLDPEAEHLCGNEHVCPEKCEMPGICEIVTELKRQTRIFEGQRGSFEYPFESEQYGLRKLCCIPIPPFQSTHPGQHVHTQIIDSVHTCEITCKDCGYFCKLPVDHPGLHDTVHGNMKNVIFVSEVEDIDLEDRKYKWGERGDAEMCGMHCRKQGRGHIHVVTCPGHNKCTGNLYQYGSRHALVKYGPDVDTPKDEMTHQTYWQYQKFVDPCTEEESREFGLCNYCCKHEEHKEQSRASQNSYCTRKLWHVPLETFGRKQSSSGYVSGDGHHFACSHLENVPYHVIFVIDKSSSMSQSDIVPTMTRFDNHKCRLGCVYEGILSFISIRIEEAVSYNDSVSMILFDTSATLAVELQDMDENVVDSLLPYHPSGFVGLGKTIQKLVTLDMEKGFAAEIVGMGTNYSSGLTVAHELMIKAAQVPSVNRKTPVVIFMSDGANNGGEDPLHRVEMMKRDEPRMVLHTILYGKEKESEALKKMAEKSGGKFRHTVDGLQLAKSFQILANSLKKPVASYM